VRDLIPGALRYLQRSTARLMRQGADWLDDVRDVTGSVGNFDGTRDFSGAPEHWRALVHERAPHLLHPKTGLQSAPHPDLSYQTTDPIAQSRETFVGPVPDTPRAPRTKQSGAMPTHSAPRTLPIRTVSEGITDVNKTVRFVSEPAPQIVKHTPRPMRMTLGTHKNLCDATVPSALMDGHTPTASAQNELALTPPLARQEMGAPYVDRAPQTLQTQTMQRSGADNFRSDDVLERQEATAPHAERHAHASNSQGFSDTELPTWPEHASFESGDTQWYQHVTSSKKVERLVADMRR